MSSDLEQRLRDAFSELPRAAREVEQRARAGALATLPPAQRRTRPRLFVFALAGAAVLVAGAAALAATGRIHVALGNEPAKPAPESPRRLVLPPGAHGLAVVADGRLWLATRAGVRIEGLPVATAELSPRALYVAVGLGRSLVAMAPDGRRAWTRRMVGRIRAIAWSPNALRIAYVVAVRSRFQLRLIEGDGDHDRLIDSRVAAVRPAWRADSLALAYAGAGGRPIVYDLGHRSRRLVPLGACSGLGPVRSLSFGSAAKLAFASRSAVWVARGSDVRCQAAVGKYEITGVAWLRGGGLASARQPLPGVGGYDAVVRHEVLADGTLGQTVASFAPTRPVALDASPRSPSLLVVLEGPNDSELAVVDAPPRRGFGELRVRQLLLRLPARTAVTALSWR